MRSETLYVGALSAGYDAVDIANRKRQAPPSVIRSADDELGSKRRHLQSAALHQARNFSIAAWAIRKHLDFVTSFSFASNNGERVGADRARRSALDDDVEGIVDEAMRAEYCDSAGRHDLLTMLRITESMAVLTGDFFWLELADGSTQMIESDRIRWPNSGDSSIVHGVRIDERGRPVAYAVHRRRGSTYEFERWIPAEFVAVRGYYDRADQVRGISPLAPALNTLRDLYESFDYALAKQKLAQLFGFKVKRDSSAAMGALTETQGSYELDLGRGPWLVDLQPGDDIEMMHADVPGGEFIAHAELMMSLALLALDLPWNFYRVDATNFFGSRAALNLYLKSCAPKRRALATLLERWTWRQLRLAAIRGRLRLPPSMALTDLRFSWTPDAVPWWNPVQEAAGAIAAIQAGLDNPQRLALENGTNVFTNIDRIAEVLAYARERGVTLSYQQSVAPISAS